MKFFLYEIAARIVGLYLLVDSIRTVRDGLVERKIPYFKYDWLDFFLDWWSTNKVVHRDAAPVRYWLLMGVEMFMGLACLLLAIFGWWQPST